MTEKPALPEDLIAEIARLAPQLTLLDHYAVLGVSEVASDDEIKAAYLRLIKRFHPDRWHSRDSTVHRKRMEAIFARVNESYEVLRWQQTRLEYDRSLYEIRGIPRPSAMPKAPPPPPPRPVTPMTAPRKPSDQQLAMAQRMMGQLRPPTKPPTPPPPPRPAPPAMTSAQAAPLAPPPVDKAGRPMIVVVEDDDTLRKMLVRIFAEIGNVREARDGQEALDVIARLEPAPRLIVTDVMMPRMDGLELAKRLKADARTARVPIVMLTAKHGPRDVIEGVNAGARVYVTKPFKVDDLKAKALKAMGPV